MSAPTTLRALTWNLFHGRSVPNAGRPLLNEFSERLASWRWDIALLQEVPPWWAAPLAGACGAEYRTALTSRNSVLPLRRAIAARWPDQVRSNGGGANVVLSRIGISEHRPLRLRRWPERRVAQLVLTADDICVANFHASTRPGFARQELTRLLELATVWASQRPLILGGDLNLRDPQVPSMCLAASGTVDFVFTRGLSPASAGTIPSRELTGTAAGVRLSDHRPLLATLRRSAVD